VCCDQSWAPNRIVTEPLPELRQPLERFDVVRCRKVDEDVPEAELDDWAQLVGDLRRRSDVASVVALLERVAVRGRSLAENLASGVLVVPQRDRDGRGSLDLVGVPPDLLAALAERRVLLAQLLDAAAGVPRVGVACRCSEGLLRPGPADQDREPLLYRARLAERVVHPVEPAVVVVDPLTVEQAAKQHDRLVEPIEAFTEPLSPCLEPEGIVLALEPRAPDPEDRPAAADLVEGRGELRGEPRVAERVRADHEPERWSGRDRRETCEGRPALEDRLLPRPDDRVQVVPGPEAVDAGLFGPERRVADGLPRARLGPQEHTEFHVHRSISNLRSRSASRCGRCGRPGNGPSSLALAVRGCGAARGR
jgi:hypothetical protein